MGLCCTQQPRSAQHASNFGHSLFALDSIHSAQGRAIFQLFGYHEVVIRTRSHLGQMGHGQHLAVVPELFHKPPHSFGYCAADSRVHLIEYQRLRRAEA